ncbi:MAG: lysophospholipid acyltransferase family protein [Candidatus Zixiibacteriota bacterium]
MKILFWTGWTFFRIVATIVFRVKIKGAENIPREGGFILASNHISYYDPPLVGCCISREVYFFAKRELFRFKPFGAILLRVNARPVNRAGVDRAAIETAIEILKSGNGLTVFPEGTRSKTNEFLPVKPGIGMIARLGAAPIIPAYIHGTNQLWNCLIGRTRLSVSYGEPISREWVGSQPESKEGYLVIADEIMSRIKGLKEALI